jgi:hypothetical protein
MKIALICESLLLKKSLETYLQGHIVSYKYANLIICDKLVKSDKPILWVSHAKEADLHIPFTKAELFWALEEFYLNILEQEISFSSKDQMKPFIEKLNKKHNSKIAKLARKIL